MKKNLFPIVLLLSHLAFAQVGINTYSPQATLDVASNAADNTKLDGIIAPRISGDLLKAKTYTSFQTGAIVYATTADSSPSGQTADVIVPGYYYFDGVSDKWINMSSGNSSSTSVSAPYSTPNSGNILLNNTHYTLRIYGGNTGVTLPDASTCKGRIYILIGSNGISSKPISVVSGGGIYDDVTNSSITSISGSQRYQIQSDGMGWIVIGR